ncbi:hypothetical protein [Micromonospora kangleipakensis]|uniref:hypothetical protein n=1 Tax=Micromonospora kangleipakensis TaxID=1077942 RepID=UPI0010298699|nr:hypothetical protein [Micromonospora kangleipakensis]
MFDGVRAPPSAVFLSPDGNLLTGQRSWQGAVSQPDRLIPAPGPSAEQRLTVAGAEVDALDLVVATLRRVADEA